MHNACQNYNTPNEVLRRPSVQSVHNCSVMPKVRIKPDGSVDMCVGTARNGTTAQHNNWRVDCTRWFCRDRTRGGGERTQRCVKFGSWENTTNHVRHQVYNWRRNARPTAWRWAAEEGISYLANFRHRWATGGLFLNLF